jgi:hypothetical protein
MSFVSDFFWHSLLAALVALILFSLPGLSILRLLGLMTRKHILAALLVAPAFGLCTYGPFSLAFTALFGYSTLTIIIAWLLFQTIVLFWIMRQKHAIGFENFCTPSHKYSLFLLMGAALCAIIPTMNIFPAVYQDALFVNGHIYDHAKIAMVDAITREGLLPINPYYAPEGETILLIYYYTWQFLASQLKLLTGATGWQVEVALNWFTGFATLSFLCALAIRITQKARTGIFLLLFALTGPPTNLLSLLLGPRWLDWVGYPPVHGLELWSIQMSWVPQHIFSALAVVVLIFIMTRILLSEQKRFSYTVVLGLTAAAAFGSSVWVGGIALLFASPFLIFMALSLGLPKPHYFNALKTALLAVAICVLFAIPLLISQTSGPSLTNAQLPFGLELYTATRLFEKETDWGYLAHIILFWFQFLPLNLGIVFVLGSLALLLYSAKNKGEQAILQALSIGSFFGFLLVVQWLQSTISNNDLGWRAVLVPIMLLMVWSAVALTALSSHHFNSLLKWRGAALLERWRTALFSLVIVGLTIGILSSLYLWHLPDPTYRLPDAQTFAMRQTFLRQKEAWAKVREYAGPSERVQANPDGYAALTPWPASIPYMLFADRVTAYASPEFAMAFAYRYDNQQRNEQYQLIQNVFSSTPSEEALRHVRDILKVKVLLVDKFDAVWHSEIIENSGLYQLVFMDQEFKIYVAS